MNIPSPISHAEATPVNHLVFPSRWFLLGDSKARSFT